MQKGRVKWFNTTKGYGFIKPEGADSEKDIFVHISAVTAAGLTSLNDDQLVEFEVEKSARDDKSSAVNLKVLG